MRAGGEKRGNCYDRHARKHWLLATFGDGTNCKCVHCGRSLNYHTIEADRIVPGQSYRHSNVQPSCHSCNLRRSDNPDWIYTPVEDSESSDDSFGVDFSAV
jgi:hypothetical protein